MELTQNQKDVLKHTITNGRFSTGGDSLDHRDCKAMAEAGYMVNHGPQALSGGDEYFTPTRDGRCQL